MKKIILTAGITGCCLLTSGCFYYPFPNQPLDTSNDVQDEEIQTPVGLKCPDNMTVLKEGGKLRTNVLNLEINSAGLYKTYESESPGDEDWRFLVVNITADSRFENSAVLYIDSTSFMITWKDLGGYAVTPETDAYIGDQLPDYNNEIRLFKKSSRTGNLIFVVPKEIDEFQLIYQKSALPFTAETETDPYDTYSDYYSGSDPYYNMPYYDMPDFDIFDFFNDYGGYGGYDDYDSYDDYNNYDDYNSYDDYGNGDNKDGYGDYEDGGSESHPETKASNHL
ncbi:hypothetical protein [Clostridium sp. AM58-1XD]|uniref:hypothetical protein n=1 Tax=Clostridium sp. AM58-1XD TaxID=2292307 RepID=UPI000E5351B9|nr:hypothetical protein [Clostridium sp. AM58-1XD]RGZ01225.1 hypothetical protein DXA13_02455 [Clostridium sp. AM58-1XD]